MCARYETIPDDEPFAEYRLTWASPRLGETRREMFPRYLGPVIRLRDGEPGMDAMQWGLVPFWAKDLQAKWLRSTFNARSETVHSAPSFREPFKSRRCLVPASCFTEFPKINGTKIRHRVSRADNRPLMFAGLWDRWTREGEELVTYTIITTEPHDGLRWLHHRMPVALERQAQERWMAPGLPSTEAKALVVCPEPDSLLAVPTELTVPPPAL